MRKRCERCGCYLDPGEWCDCDEHDQPEQEMGCVDGEKIKDDTWYTLKNGEFVEVEE